MGYSRFIKSCYLGISPMIWRFAGLLSFIGSRACRAEGLVSRFQELMDFKA